VSEILYFKRGKKGSPVSFLPNGKVVLPERGREIEAGFFYVGEIVKELERFCVFRPERKTVFKKEYSCGHVEIVSEGTERDEVEKVKCECPTCRGKKGDELLELVSQIPSEITQENWLTKIERWVNGKTTFYSFDELKAEIEADIKGYTEAKKAVDMFLAGKLSFKVQEETETGYILEADVDGEKMEIQVDEGFACGNSVADRYWKLLQDYRYKIIADKIGIWPCISSEIANWTMDEKNRLKKENETIIKITCPKCGGNCEKIYRKVTEYVPESDDGYRPASYIDIDRPFLHCNSCGYEERIYWEESEVAEIHVETETVSREMKEGIEVEFELVKKTFHVKYDNGNVETEKTVAEAVVKKVVLDYPYSCCECHLYEGKVERKNENKRILKLLKLLENLID